MKPSTYRTPSIKYKRKIEILANLGREEEEEKKEKEREEKIEMQCSGR